MGLVEDFMNVVGIIATTLINNSGETSRTIITTIVQGLTDIVSILFTGSK